MLSLISMQLRWFFVFKFVNRGVTPGNDNPQHVDSMLKGVARLTGRSAGNSQRQNLIDRPVLVKGRNWLTDVGIGGKRFFLTWRRGCWSRPVTGCRDARFLANENGWEGRGSGAFHRGLTEISSLDSYVSARVHCLVVFFPGRGLCCDEYLCIYHR